MARRLWPRALLSLQLALIALLGAMPVRADGSFPDARQILLPAERPEQIIVVTNFGLLYSEDGGKTWLFSCQHGSSANAAPYLLTARPSPRLVALTGDGLIYSDDDSCTWNAARGSLTNVLPYALAVDPSDAERVYVIGAARDEPRGSESIYISDDGGLTFGEPAFTAPQGSALLGVLAAPVLGGALFAAMFSSPENHPILLRSDDGGRQWRVVADLVDSLGNHPFELLALDPNDPDKLFVRVLGASSEALAISHDGGLSFAQALAIPGKLKAFLQLRSGTILLGGTVGTAPAAYRSQDGGGSFAVWTGAPRVHALAERNGKLYIAADNFLDGYAIGESDDEGINIEPLGGFEHVRAVKSCVSLACAKSCAYQAGIKLWPETVCGDESTAPGAGGSAGSSATAGDAGAESNAGAHSAQPHPSGAGGVDDAAARASPRAVGGCSCATVGARPARGWSWLLGLGLMRAARRARRGRLGGGARPSD